MCLYIYVYMYIYECIYVYYHFSMSVYSLSLFQFILSLYPSPPSPSFFLSLSPSPLLSLSLSLLISIFLSLFFIYFVGLCPTCQPLTEDELKARFAVIKNSPVEVKEVGVWVYEYGKNITLWWDHLRNFLEGKDENNNSKNSNNIVYLK